MVNTQQTRTPVRRQAGRGVSLAAPTALTAQPAPPARDMPHAAPPVRRRMGAQQREQQILEGAIDFFARRGLDAQMRELAGELGIAHTLLYHYFPTKRQLIERVYEHTIAGRWDVRWEQLLDDTTVPAAQRLHGFYRQYLAAILTPDWIRILVHSGLSDGLIPNRYFELVRTKLFPRLLRVVRLAAGNRSRARATPREEALLMSFHGGLIYHLGIWPLVYQQHFTGQGDVAMVDTFIADRISGLLLQAGDVVVPTAAVRTASTASTA